MRILAFDISASPGVAVLEVKKKTPRLLLADSIKTSTGNSDSQRYAYVEAFAIKAIHEHGPFDVVVREHFTKGGSKRSTQLVFGAWSMIDSALGRYGYAVDSEITPSKVKLTVGGKGTADKLEVEAGVRKILKLSDEYSFKSDDASDACAIGLTYLINEGLIAK
jgi:crossover junction endodeoxyribonuclease RuvC